jgi:hypothetical protein
LTCPRRQQAAAYEKSSTGYLGEEGFFISAELIFHYLETAGKKTFHSAPEKVD